MDLKKIYKISSIVGTIAGIILLNEKANLEKIAEVFLDYVQKNSCGKCVPCRIGTKRLSELFRKFVNKSLDKKEQDFLFSLSKDVAISSKCDLGRIAGELILCVTNKKLL